MINLSERVKEAKGKEITGKFPFEDLFTVELKYVPRATMRKTLERCKKAGWNAAHEKIEELDNGKFLKFMAEVILSWDLTVGTLASIIPIDFTDEEKDLPVECTPANKLIVLQEAYAFDFFVRESCATLAMFKEEGEEAERKNLESSPDGG